MEFVRNHPALRIGDALVVADIHIGITRDIWERGVSLPPQAASLAERVNALKRLTGTKRLVALGDVKHAVPRIALREFEEVPAFFKALDYRKITVVKGNHDGHIERVLPPGIRVAKSLALGGALLTHGHRNVKTGKKTIVIGHNQPHVRFVDEMRASYVEPVWVIGKLNGAYDGKKVIIMPAFNELCGAGIVNKDELMGPIAKNLVRQSARCVLLDGTDLGAVSALKERTPTGIGKLK